MGHRITADHSKRTKGLGREYLFVALYDHARVAFTDMRPDERKDSAESFLRAAVAYFARMGVKIQRLIADKGPAFRPLTFHDARIERGIKLKFTRAYRPQNQQES